MSKKKDTISALFRHCRAAGKLEFDNDIVKQVSMRQGIKFRNQFDATKIDQSKFLPDDVRNAGYCIAHLGKGRHRFIKELKTWYHQFEEIGDSDKNEWNYKPSLLNHTDDSESNVISMLYNQRIIHRFLYEDITAEPRIYLSRRTKITATYMVGSERINAESLQMEMDATFENDGVVTILEGKNDQRKRGGFPDDFAVHQLFHPFLYYRQNVFDTKRVECCYLLQKRLREQDSSEEVRAVRLYLYSFSDVNDMASISLARKAQYTFKPN